MSDPAAVPPTDPPLDHRGFRALFPALERWHWLDTPGSPPAARPVAEALQTAVSQWLAGQFDWLDLDARPARARALLAALHGVREQDVALMGSVAEAAATVARSLPPGPVVVAEQEFRSALLPWLELDPGRNPVVRVPGREDRSLTEGLVEALRPGTALLAVSSVLSSDGAPVDLDRLREASAAVGARLFVDATQSLGVLGPTVADLAPDYLAVHGYKWMLCPRGAAWLVVRRDRQPELRPLAPGWKSTPRPHGYFGPVQRLAPGAPGLDTQSSWLPWIGADAALRLHLRLDPEVVRAHCTRLADTLLRGLLEAGFSSPNPDGGSHIVVAQTGGRSLDPDVLPRNGIKALHSGTRLRFGVHYFNDDDDVAAVLAAVRAG